MFYERKVKYLDYLVGQERRGNAGFLKLEVRENLCNLTINVSNLREADLASAEVYLVGGGLEKKLCGIDLVNGRGVKQITGQDMHNIGNTGIAYKDLEGVRIPISSGREIYGIVGEEKGKVVDSGCVVEPKIAVESEGAVVSESATEPESVAEAVIVEESESVTEPEKVAESQIVTESVNYREEKPDRKMPLCDDKWKQLWEIYPHITPFRDEREYLSVGPGDFVILPWKYFHMANNSFLLHGYYNYKHLILKRLEYHGEVRYYVGVPGNFYDREKQVAVMFGFESFESLEEPACTGDYGYYLMRIEL